MTRLKAIDRRRVADRAAELAVDMFVDWMAERHHSAFPEELLELQHNLEDELYRELA